MPKNQIHSLTAIIFVTTVIMAATWMPNLAHSQQTEPSLDGTLHSILDQQSQAWNRGDIDAFMTAYWDSPELSFSSGGQTTRGWEATRDRYKTRYPNREIMGKLTFSHLETRKLGDSAAMTLGRWHLERAESVGGNFSLVWQKFGDQWLIVHDHSSSTPSNKP